MRFAGCKVSDYFLEFGRAAFATPKANVIALPEKPPSPKSDSRKL